MTIAAKISSTELTAQVTARFSGKYLEGRLIDATGTSYIPGTTDDATFLGFEVAAGTGGYQRQVIKYDPADILAYSDDGVPLNRKATVFAHDGGGTSIDFSHVALVWSDGNVTALAAVASAPTAGNDGTYTNIPTTTDGSGVGLTVDLTIANSGVATTDYTLTIASPGYGYAASDIITIADGVLAGLGAITGGAGSLGTTVSTVETGADAGDLLTVAETASAVVLTGGNEAVFYWDLKQFGFYSV